MRRIATIIFIYKERKQIMKRSRSKFLCMLFAILLSLSVVPFAAFAAETTEEPGDFGMVSTEITMTPGASIRVADDYGIRFEAKIDKAFFELWGDDIEVGMLIAPTKNVEGKSFTESSLAEGDYLKVKSSGYAAEDDNGKTFRVALVGFQDTKEAVTMGFSARAYAVVKDSTGAEREFYSAYDPENSRSLYDVAFNCSGTKEYKDNAMVQKILSLAPGEFGFSWVSMNGSDAAPADVAVIKRDSFEFTAKNAAAEPPTIPHYLNSVRVKSTATIQVGQQVEFDYTWLANAVKDCEIYMWLMNEKDGLEKMTDWSANDNSVYSALKIKIKDHIKNDKGEITDPGIDMQQAGLGTNLYNIGMSKFTDGGAGDGKAMHYNRKQYHITMAVFPGTNGQNPHINVTLTELDWPVAGDADQSEARSYTFSVTATQNKLENIALVFGSAGVSYRITNLKVSDIPSQFSRYEFSLTNDAITIEKDAFQYNEAFVKNDYYRSSSVASNQLLKVGNKVEFDYEMLNSADGGEALFWFKENGAIHSFNKDEENPVKFALRFVHTGESRDLQLGLGEQVRPATVSFGGTKDVKKYHVTIEIIRGSSDGKIQFKCTIAELGIENPVEGSWTSIEYDASILNNITLVFASSRNSYRISGFKVA